MDVSPNENLHDKIKEIVNCSAQICLAIDQHLTYLTLNQAACNYLRLKDENGLVGKTAIQVYPEIIASRNHRNILRALSGLTIVDDLVESRMGDILKVTYEPVIVAKEVKAVILNAVVYLPPAH